MNLKSHLFVLGIVSLGIHSLAMPRAEFSQRSISVDGKTADWEGIAPNTVRGSSHLWFGQGMTPEKWTSDRDLSYQWRGAWSGDYLYFLVEVTDDRLVQAGQLSSYLCDCVEIYIDYNHQGGKRVKVLDGREDWIDRCDPKEMMGYELHFLPTDPPRVYLDHTYKYALDKPQTDRFKKDWEGRSAFRRTANGYLIEAGFKVPGVALKPGKTLGIEIGVCDDDGNGRESIMMWTGTKADFWITMDEYGEVALRGAPEFKTIRNPDGSHGIVVTGVGSASVAQSHPLQLEVWNASRSNVVTLGGAYADVVRKGSTWNASGNLKLNEGVTFRFSDSWTLANDALRLRRTVKVSGNAEGGFLSAAIFDLAHPPSWTNIQWFAPGMIYGGSDHLSPGAIGGSSSYKPGQTVMRIREDRLPAPLITARFADGTTATVLNLAPDGRTTLADAESVAPGLMIDEGFRFGALGAEEAGQGIRLGYWFPGSEGSQTYAGNTYPGGHIEGWRHRFHPIRDGLEQRYELAFRFGQGESLPLPGVHPSSGAANTRTHPDVRQNRTPLPRRTLAAAGDGGIPPGLPAAYREVWRWAFDTLRPEVNPVNIPAARKSMVKILSKCVVETNGWAGIPNFLNVMTKNPRNADSQAIMGFTGKNLEAANFMLQEASLGGSDAGELRRKAEAIISSFLKLNMAPPEAEGFNLRTGAPAIALRGKKQVYLRSFGDDLKALMIAWAREKKEGRDHPEWLAWCRSFGEWLLGQQQAAGGFPRSWVPGTGEVVSASPNSSYNAVPLLALLHEATGEKRFLDAAIRAADFCWKNGQSRGLFVGGTIDNPDVLDKEAATLSLEAYLQLHKSTGEKKWLDRAEAAADFAETWVYIWNVPMPADADPGTLGWKPGVSTIGAQLIASGHSLVDCYMAFDADDFARLAKLTGDAHYRSMARLLLHNTKGMLALPGRTYDLGEPGWQQEHWSFAPRRGNGLHRGWLPWVSTSHLNGIFGVMEEDPALLTDAGR